MLLKVSRTTVLFACAMSVSMVTLAADPKAAPDVVGRDFAEKYFGWLGHVGVWTGTDVLEMLGATPFIQRNSLKNFQSRSKYWGARYGIGQSSGTAVVNAGWRQRLYSPAYTATSVLWQEGGNIVQSCVAHSRSGACVKYISVQTTAVFRCDTFVNYSFWRGTGSNLVKGSSITPTIAFNSMPSSR